PGPPAGLRGLMTAMGYDPDDATPDPASPAGVGNQAAAALLAFRATDGSNQAGGYSDTSGYVPVNTPDQVNDPFHWQPLRFVDASGNTIVQKYATPHWQNVTPFALTSPNQFLPPGPTQRTLLQLDEEATDTLLQSATLTDLSKVRAEYWADGPASETPPGHWLLFGGAAPPAPGPHLRPGAGLHPRTEPQADLCPGQRRAGRQHRRLERQAPLGLRAAHHGGPNTHEGQVGARLGRPLQGRAAHPGRDLASLPGGDLPDPAVPRVRVRALHLQRGRGQ